MRRKMGAVSEREGRRERKKFRGSAYFLYLCGNALLSLFHFSPGRYHYLISHVVQQIYFTAIQSFQLVFIIGLALGILAVLPFSSLGFTDLDVLATIIGNVLFRQLAPFFTAIVVIGRSGSAITSEISSMHSQQALDGLLLDGIDPHHLIVLPRIIGVSISMLFLTAWMVVGAILGASSLVLLVDSTSWFGVIRACSSMITVAEFSMIALMMAWFGMTIATIHCYYGFISDNAVKTAQNLSRAFVSSFLSCLGVIILFTLVRYV